jgi:hypothetical protein
MRPFLDPVREQELLKLAERKRRQQDTQRNLQPVFEQIAKLHTPKGKPAPKPYDAWSYPARSIPNRMKGIKNCPECLGNGYTWIDLGKDAFGWIRCQSCRTQLVAAWERA